MIMKDDLPGKLLFFIVTVGILVVWYLARYNF